MIHEYKNKYKDRVVNFYHKVIDFTKEFYVLELDDGSIYVQTTTIDFLDEIVLTELLYGTFKDEDTFVLIDRERSGGGFHEMKSYPRDDAIPMWSMIKVT